MSYACARRIYGKDRIGQVDKSENRNQAVGIGLLCAQKQAL